METKTHWEHVYATKDSAQVSWYQTHATTSLKLIAASSMSRDAALLDVGGSASTWVDDLLDDTGVHLLPL